MVATDTLGTAADPAEAPVAGLPLALGDVTCICAREPFVVLGFSSGAIAVYHETGQSAGAHTLPSQSKSGMSTLPESCATPASWRWLDGLHRGDVLCAALSIGGDVPCLVTGGSDGWVRFILPADVSLRKRVGGVRLGMLVGATSGTEGMLVESVVADAKRWAAPVGRYVVVGALPCAAGSSDVNGVCLGPSTHVVDAVQLCGHVGSLQGAEHAIAAASFGGVSLWVPRGAAGGANAALDFERATRMPEDAPPLLAAAKCSVDADLTCEGWARSLAVSPDGAWLAAWVTIAAESPTKLWLWRLTDGADFECGGFQSPSGISALTWRLDSSALASCSGTSVLVWLFPPPPDRVQSPGNAIARVLRSGPAGRPPLVLTAAGGACGRFLSAAFDPDGKRLACGTSAGSVHIFAVLEQPTHQPGGANAAAAACHVWWPERGVVEHLVWTAGGLWAGREQWSEGDAGFADTHQST